MNEFRDVRFRATRSKHDNCVCDECGRTDKVTKLAIPKTKRGGPTRYKEYWLCDRCTQKLIDAIIGAKE